MTRRLAIFDVDGTLVDSQHGIVAAMDAAFVGAGLAAPTRQQTLAIVGLSLAQAVAVLLPGESEAMQRHVVDGYKAHFQSHRVSGLHSHPLFDGILDILDRLAEEGWLLGIATGNSDKGLAMTLEAHGIIDRFATLQTADRHPSKPHPGMIVQALAETGVDPAATLMIGDTSFDMAMARAAGVRALGVGWGYHQPAELLAAGAQSVAMDSPELSRHIGLP